MLFGAGNYNEEEISLLTEGVDGSHCATAKLTDWSE